MSKERETPELRRERLRQKELNNPASSIHGSNTSDLAGSLNWKGTGIIILVIIAAFTIYAVFFR
ncbi:DUF6366 family protein [Thalassobacillus devorans]|uniref:DUF6366 family protein n=1 Tax=Thalassobacillus devorans TaxID=279813 RepID=UPI000490A325|nr:DUF6366 family protein [Thalassobacillus devorans]